MTNYERTKEWRKNNPEKVAEYARRYRKKHPEVIKRAKAKYYAANLEEIRKKARVKARLAYAKKRSDRQEKPKSE